MTPNEVDLFAEEENMVRMSFGEHIEELRRRLVLALVGFVPALIIGLLAGKDLVRIMKEPVMIRLQEHYDERLAERINDYNERKKQPGSLPQVRLEAFVTEESWNLALNNGPPAAQANPNAVELEGAFVKSSDPSEPTRRLVMWMDEELLRLSAWRDQFQGLFSLSVQETFMAWMKVGIVAGLIIASPWIIYHLWMFVAEGLFRHERKVVYKAAPISVGLFLAGVLFCFVVVLPMVIQFFFGFNLWLGVDPGIRLSEWLGFAAMLPLIFGICFELPIVMMVLHSIGIFGAEDYISKWRHAVLTMAFLAMVITPTADPGTMMMLMMPMCGLYFLGIVAVRSREAKSGQATDLGIRARIGIAIGMLAVVYMTVLKCGFYLKYLSFAGVEISDQWWFDNVWYYGAWPSSWAIDKWESKGLSLETPGMITAATLANSGLAALVFYRLGEMLLAMFGKGDKKKDRAE